MVIQVTAAKSDNFWRCGKQFTRNKPVNLEVGVDITEEDYKIISEESMLVVRVPEEERNKIKDALRKEIKNELRKEILNEIELENKDNENESKNNKDKKLSRTRTTKKD